jgi:DNA polymerase III alpha subunit
MTSLCRQCNVHDIDTLIAIVSVIRPGAANEGKKLAFTRRYQGLEPITYPHPSLEPVLNDTFGLVVYEEHILQICEAFAGLPPGRADVLRRALNKQKRAVIDEIHQEFLHRRQRAAIRRRRSRKCGGWSPALPAMPSAKRTQPRTASRRINRLGSSGTTRRNSWPLC